MLGDSYVFVVFEDGTDLYGRVRAVLEYMQQIEEPSATYIPSSAGATGAGWIYEYVLVDRTHGAVSLSSAAFKIGICAIARNVPVSPKSRPSEDSSSIPGECRSQQLRAMASAFTVIERFAPARTKSRRGSKWRANT